MRTCLYRILHARLECVRWLLFLCLLSSNTVAIEPVGWEFPQTGRIVAFADVHGAYNELLELLRQAEVIDGGNNWTGGATQLVSLGDLFDRGPDSRRVVELLMRLQEQAPGQGGSVHLVLGNHEMMLATGDLRYVSGNEYAAYAGEETEQDRAALYQQYVEIRPNKDQDTLRVNFDKNFPPGFIALSKAHGPEGKIGQWLLAEPLILKIGDNLFMHGGLPPQLAELSLAEVNQELKQDLLDYLAIVGSLTAQNVLKPVIDYFDREPWLNQLIARYKVTNGKRAEPAWAG